jgi:hypothetical protein
MSEDGWKRNENGAIDCALVVSSQVARGGGIVALQLLTQAAPTQRRGELIQVALGPEDAISIGQALLDGGREALAVRDGKAN